MAAAYVSQGINLLVTVLMVPLLLSYLNVNEYVLWSIFTTLGGITLQFENAIQMVSVREIAKEYHGGSTATLQAAILRAKKAYTTLAIGVLIPVMAIGLLYLSYVAAPTLRTHGSVEWIAFMLVYALNYYLGMNNSILLGMAQVIRYSNTISVTRLLNFGSTFLFLKAGLGLGGLCASFAVSVVVGCTAMLRAATKTLAACYASHRPGSLADNSLEHLNSRNTVKYTAYMLSSFLLYRGGLLIATRVFTTEQLGTYGLTLQAYTMVTALALVPLQVWLSRLVKAIAAADRQATLRQLAFVIITANAIFVSGSALVALLGNALLKIIGSEISLVSPVGLLLMSLAFMVELNILMLASFLISKGNYSFVRPYMVTSLVGTALVILIASSSMANLHLFVAVPLLLQTVVCLPIVLAIASRELALTPREFLIRLGASAAPGL